VSDGALAGCRILVTRPVGQADELCQAIEAAGGEAIRFPVIRVTARDPQRVRDELAHLPAPDIAIFISSNAVQHGLGLMHDTSATIVAVGPATAAAIRACGREVDVCPERGFDSEHLLAHPALQDVAGRSVLILRGETGRPLLGDTLRERGARVDYLAVYCRGIDRQPDEVVAALANDWREGRVHCVTVMSGETFEALLAQLPSDLLERLRETPLVAPSERVLKTARKLVPGIPAILASGPRTADLLNALIDWRQSGQDS